MSIKAKYEDCLIFNTLPGIEFHFDEKSEFLPTNVLAVIKSGIISDEGRTKFINKFLSYYITEEFIREAFDGYSFLFFR